MTLTPIQVRALEESKLRRQSWGEYLKNWVYGSFLLTFGRYFNPEQSKLASEMLNYDDENEDLLKKEENREN